MTVEIVKFVVARFLSDSDPGVLVVKGAWGVGKTHAWNDILLTKRDALKIPQYAYVSLFGLKAVSELRTAIVAKTIPSKYIGRAFDWDTVNREWFELVKPMTKRLTALFPKIKSAIPYIKDVSISFDSIAGYLLGNAIICLDDWERTKIAPEELLGFISELKLERKCKVVLIFNDGKLDDDQKAGDKEYREKVVDIELAFSPTSKEAVDIVIQSGTAHADLLKDKILRLDISNIRLIGTIVSLVRLLGEYIEKARAVVQDQVIATSVLMTWVHYGEESPRKPPIDFVRKWNNLGAVLRARKDGVPENPQEQEWAAVLNGFGYTSSDELDLAVDQVIERGYTEGTDLVSQLQAREQMLAAAEIEQTFAKAWELFHSSFANNEQELVDALNRGLRHSVKYVSPMNFNGTIALLRQLNRDALADELIEFYVNSRGDEEGLFDLERAPFGGEVTDEQVRKRFAEVNVAHMNKPNLFDAITGAAAKQGWSREEDEIMKGATADEIYRLIMVKDGAEEGLEFLRACVWLSSVNGWQDFRAKLTEALTKVAATSRLNAVRVRRFGVVLR